MTKLSTLAMVTMAVIASTIYCANANAQVAGDTFSCSKGLKLKVVASNSRLTTFQLGSKKFQLADTSPYGATFRVFGDTQSPKGTGISFSNHGIGGQINGTSFSSGNRNADESDWKALQLLRNTLPLSSWRSW